MTTITTARITKTTNKLTVVKMMAMMQIRQLRLRSRDGRISWEYRSSKWLCLCNPVCGGFDDSVFRNTSIMLLGIQSLFRNTLTVSPAATVGGTRESWMWPCPWWIKSSSSSSWLSRIIIIIMMMIRWVSRHLYDEQNHHHEYLQSSSSSWLSKIIKIVMMMIRWVSRPLCSLTSRVQEWIQWPGGIFGPS